MSLPLVKFGVLVVKQAAKPLANSIKKVVKKSDLFGKIIAVPGQVYHRFDQTIRMRILGWEKEVTIKPLSQKAATDLGAEILGELIIFGVAVGTLKFEYARSSRKEKAKEEKQNMELASLQNQITELRHDLQNQIDVNLKLTVVVNDLVNRISEKSLEEK